MTTETIQLQRWSMDDIDEQSNLLPGWEQEYRQHSCGKSVGNVSTTRGPRVTIVGEETNQPLHESVAPRDGDLVFALILNDDNALKINGQQGMLVEDALRRSVVSLAGPGAALLRQFWRLLSHAFCNEAAWPTGMPSRSSRIRHPTTSCGRRT